MSASGDVCEPLTPTIPPKTAEPSKPGKKSGLPSRIPAFPRSRGALRYHRQSHSRLAPIALVEAQHSAQVNPKWVTDRLLIRKMAQMPSRGRRKARGRRCGL